MKKVPSSCFDLRF